MSEHLYDPQEVARLKHISECKECQELAWRENNQKECVFYLTTMGLTAIFLLFVFRRFIISSPKNP